MFVNRNSRARVGTLCFSAERNRKMNYVCVVRAFALMREENALRESGGHLDRGSYASDRVDGQGIIRNYDGEHRRRLKSIESDEAHRLSSVRQERFSSAGSMLGIHTTVSIGIELSTSLSRSDGFSCASNDAVGKQTASPTPVIRSSASRHAMIKQQNELLQPRGRRM